MKYIKVPACLLEKDLKGNELKVYVYLLTCQNRLGTATVRIRTIQDRCRIGSASTVRNALAGLSAQGLLSATPRYGNSGRCISSRFDLCPLPGAWFAVDLSKELFYLDKSAFAAYLYMIQQCRNNGHAWPSYSRMAAALRLARNTVIAAVKRLANFGLLLKAALRGGKHNLYTLFSTVGARIGMKKERAAAPEKPRLNSYHWKLLTISALIVASLALLVKGFMAKLRHFFSCCFFRKIGSAIFDHQYIDLSLYNQERKKHIEFY
jgi:hypothetical protein